MDPTVAEALTYLNDHWGVEVFGTSDASALLDINTSTLKTRISRGQALAFRETEGRQRAAVSFTGSHLVYNLIGDRMLRYGFGLENEVGEPLPWIYAEWAQQNILTGPRHIDAILRLKKDGEGRVAIHMFEDGDADPFTGDAALIIPIGVMVLRLAVTLHHRAIAAARNGASISSGSNI